MQSLGTIVSAKHSMYPATEDASLTTFSVTPMGQSCQITKVLLGQEDTVTCLYSESGNQLEVVGLVSNGPITIGAHDGPILQIKNAGHLVRIFLNHANAVFLHCA